MEVRRRLRDWVVDTVLFLFAALFGLILADVRLTSLPMPDPAWLFDADQIVSAFACVGVWLRRRWPVQLAVGCIALSTFAELVAGATLVALFTVALHRPLRTTLALFALGVAASAIYLTLRPEADAPQYLVLLFGVVLQSAVVGWGLFLRHRRELMLSLRERAVRAEAEAELRAERAQLQTRETIAREMHDVLGHRLSLLSVHAGALEFRPDAPAADIARAAAVIRDSAHRALQDLREVIGVLRAPVSELPQPTIDDLPRLVAESVEAGMRVDLHEEVEGEVPATAGRTAYRIVQEGLTNVRKHAQGADVTVTVSGTAERGLTVEVVNTAGTATGVSSGQGLLGLAERIALAGGRFERGPTPDGGWRVSAWLPWRP